MKTICAAIDGLKRSPSTIDYSIYLAQRAKASVVGLFLEDFTYHGYKLFDMVGSQGVSSKKIHELMANDKEARKNAVDEFATSCKREFISHVVHCREDSAIRELLTESVYSDLLVINAAETFSHFHETTPTTFIRQVMAESRCPVLIVPETFREIGRVIVLYDGKASSVFAAKMFAYLFPFLSEIPVEIVSVVSSDEDRALRSAEVFREFAERYFPGVTVTLLHGKPHKELPAFLSHLKDAMVVLGAYDRSQASMWFRQSLADVLLEQVHLPLLVAHNK